MPPGLIEMLYPLLDRHLRYTHTLRIPTQGAHLMSQVRNLALLSLERQLGRQLLALGSEE